MFDLPDVRRAGTRRILVCPYCNGLQAIPRNRCGPPSDAGNVIGVPRHRGRSAQCLGSGGRKGIIRRGGDPAEFHRPAG